MTADLGAVRRVRGSRLRPEFPTRRYEFALEASRDGKVWTRLPGAGVHAGSPVTLRHPVTARYLRLTVATSGAGLWEWSID
ncbi:discoidin domain-containing protein [Sphingomonas sp. MMS24-JH45]